MSKFTSTVPKTDNWADAESDDEDEEHEIAEDEDENDDDLVDEGEDDADEDDEEEEDDDIHFSPRVPTSKVVVPSATIQKEKKVDISQLSKKERQELKKKELEDLDSLLADFVVDAPKVAAAEAEPAVTLETSGLDADANEEANKAKKSKKKKKKLVGGDDKVDIVSKASVEESPESETVTVVADVSTILKSKLKKTKKVTVDPQKVAVSEALKAVSSSDAKKKKKKDKSKLGYNETSY